MKTVSGRLARWTLLLAEYDFDIEYIQGRAQEIADYLSRDAIINDLEPKRSSEEDLDFSNFVHDNFLITRAKIYKELEKGEGNEDAEDKTLSKFDDPDRLSYKLRKRPYNWRELIRYAHSFGHYKSYITYNRLKLFTRWHGMYKDVNTVLRGCHVCNLNDYRNKKVTIPLKIYDKGANVMTHLTIDFQTD
eukprot:Nk52_evm1s877 gene=Nk52_evmTU1s877